jgi:CubicO group peptidase (beta-lactamase class C family)
MSSRFRLTILALVSVAALFGGVGLGAQALPFLLFERYLDPLRIQAGIPGLSAVILQDDRIVWERGFGSRDLEANLPATPDTPYAIADLTQTITATLLLHCAERGALELDAPIGN